MSHKVNLAIQVLPLQSPTQQAAYAIVDEAIACIQASGLMYVVCPFETVVEGTYEEVMALLNNIQAACFKAGAPSLLINMKLHVAAEHDMAIDDKIGKYK